jgi:Rps23 Pro-64 3,4-dihydroxylase Tpa1-like proline 4-hydroxylase
VQAVCRATGFPDLLPDSSLYAGGISLMQRGNFLLPHLDNSHDAERGRYRRLNLLYYVTPHWSTEEGGHLELWDNGPKHSPRQLESRFNRLVIMATHKNSWHSVCEVKANRPRLCVSNYYYSDQPYEGDAYFHVTSFRARPDQPARDLLLRTDNALRSAIRKVAKKGVYRPETFQHKDKGVDS